MPKQQIYRRKANYLVLEWTGDNFIPVVMFMGATYGVSEEANGDLIVYRTNTDGVVSTSEVRPGWLLIKDIGSGMIFFLDKEHFDLTYEPIDKVANSE